ncbi:MAG: alpha/beta hydrolase [bacterium]|nr:alpha/beta hydrolase [bacterium]
MVGRVLLVLSFVLSLLPPVHAADQTVLGQTLTVKSPGAPEKRAVTVKAKETATDATLVGNPVTAGATVAVTLTGPSPSAATYALPAGASAVTGKPFWSGDAAKGFSYRDPKGENGPVKAAQIKRRGTTFQISVAIDGKHAAVALVPPGTGTGCVLLTIGGGDSYSVAFANGGKITSTPTLFKYTKPSSEASCVPTTTTTTTTSTTTTSTTVPDLPNLVPPGAAPLRYRDLVFAGATVTSNIVYGSAVNNSGQTVTLLMDRYEPTGDSVTARPAIVWIHGGSFSSGSKTSAELVDQATVFARKGYLNVSISYRLEPGGCASSVPTAVCLIAIGEALDDAQTAIRFLRTNAAAWGIDATRIAVAGTSAGAITALNVGYSNNEEPDAAVAAAVSLSGARILTTPNPGEAPALLFHGTSDVVVPYQWAVDTVNAASAAGLDVFLTTWPGAGHVPYAANRTQIIDQTTNFLFWEMDLANAAH